jgi:MFS family permease
VNVSDIKSLATTSVDAHVTGSPGLVARAFAAFAGQAAVPDIRGRLRLLAALSVDTLGVGLFLPLAFYFFTVTTTLSVSGIGFTMTCATLSALPLAPFGGLLTDRWGARRMVVTSNLLTACGYLAYPIASSYLGIFLCVFLVMVADRLYFASWPTLIASIARVDQLDSWFALVRSVNAGGVVVGSVLSTLFLASGGSSVIKVIAVANACSSVIAAGLTASQPLGRAAAVSAGTPRTGLAGATASTGSPRLTSPLVALADRPFRRLLLAQLLIATAWAIPGAFLPLYLTHVLLLPAWCTTLVTATNCFLLFVFQLRVTHAVRHVGRLRAILTGIGFILGALACIAAAAVLAHGMAAIAIVLAGIALYTMGEMLVLPSTYAIVASIAPREARGVYMSMFQITGIMAFGIGPGLVGWLFEIEPLAVLAVVSLFVIAGAGVLGLGRAWLTGAAAHRGTDDRTEDSAV